jgi:hypothetical protein
MRVKVHGERRIYQTMLILLAVVVIHMSYFNLISAGDSISGPMPRKRGV